MNYPASMMASNEQPIDTKPKRLIIRLHNRHQQFPELIIQRALALQGMSESTDYSPKVCNWHAKLYIVLDVRCNEHPNSTTSSITYEVYDVKKVGDQL